MLNSRTLLPVLAASAIAIAAQSASAATINSFLSVGSISGINVSPLVASPNLSFTVTLNAGATFELSGTTYNITDIIGFYLLAPGYNDGAQGALAVTGGFSDDSDARAAGSIYGWRSNPNDGITPGNSLTFTFPSISYADYTQIGFHVILDGTFPGTSGNTGNITGTVVPTPGAAALIGLGGLAVARRRRV